MERRKHRNRQYSVVSASRHYFASDSRNQS